MTEEIIEALAIEMRTYVDGQFALMRAQVQALIDAIPPAERGERGEKGDPGAPGEAREGPPGRDGATIVGPMGPQGERGADGRDGREGKDGRDGKDSDLTKAHFEATVEAEVSKRFDALLRTIRCDGRALMLGDNVVAKLAVPLYREVWKEGERYDQGDAVTYGGSLWICLVEHTTDKPDSDSRAWRCAVKKGRDGKDGNGGAPAGPSKPVRLA